MLQNGQRSADTGTGGNQQRRRTVIVIDHNEKNGKDSTPIVQSMSRRADNVMMQCVIPPTDSCCIEETWNASNQPTELKFRHANNPQKLELERYQHVLHVHISCTVPIGWIFSSFSTMPVLKCVSFGSGCFVDELNDSSEQKTTTNQFNIKQEKCPSVKEFFLRVEVDQKYKMAEQKKKKRIFHRIQSILNSAKHAFPKLTILDLSVPLDLNLSSEIERFTDTLSQFKGKGSETKHKEHGILHFKVDLSENQRKLEKRKMCPPPNQNQSRRNGNNDIPCIDVEEEDEKLAPPAPSQPKTSPPAPFQPKIDLPAPSQPKIDPPAPSEPQNISLQKSPAPTSPPRAPPPAYEPISPAPPLAPTQCQPIQGNITKPVVLNGAGSLQSSAKSYQIPPSVYTGTQQGFQFHGDPRLRQLRPVLLQTSTYPVTGMPYVKCNNTLKQVSRVLNLNLIRIKAPQAHAQAGTTNSPRPTPPPKQPKVEHNQTKITVGKNNNGQDNQRPKSPSLLD